MLDAHLGRCADCREFEAAVAEFTTELRAAPLEPLRRAGGRSSPRRGLASSVTGGVAAAMALAVAGVASRIGLPISSRPAGGFASAAPATLFTTSWPTRTGAGGDLADAPVSVTPEARRRAMCSRGCSSPRMTECRALGERDERPVGAPGTGDAGRADIRHVELRAPRPSEAAVGDHRNVFPNHA